jgi:hypothetical protein
MKENPYAVSQSAIFQLFGPRLNHFISKYFAKKRGNLLTRGKLLSLHSTYIDRTYFSNEDTKLNQ